LSSSRLFSCKQQEKEQASGSWWDNALEHRFGENGGRVARARGWISALALSNLIWFSPASKAARGGGSHT
jgi:hypothetical protein